jgi:hypothetical protein
MTKQQTGNGPAQHQIRVMDRLGNKWSERFEGEIIVSDRCKTTISGKETDEATLHGLPNRGREPPWLGIEFSNTE